MPTISHCHAHSIYCSPNLEQSKMAVSSFCSMFDVAGSTPIQSSSCPTTPDNPGETSIVLQLHVVNELLPRHRTMTTSHPLLGDDVKVLEKKVKYCGQEEPHYQVLLHADVTNLWVGNASSYCTCSHSGHALKTSTLKRNPAAVISCSPFAFPFNFDCPTLDL